MTTQITIQKRLASLAEHLEEWWHGWVIETRDSYAM